MATSWCVCINALNPLRTVLTPATPDESVALGKATRPMLLAVILDEGSWPHAAGVRLFGDSRKPPCAALYR